MLRIINYRNSLLSKLIHQQTGYYANDIYVKEIVNLQYDIIVDNDIRQRACDAKLRSHMNIILDEDEFNEYCDYHVSYELDEDNEERNSFIDKVNKFSKIIKKEVNSRRLVIQQKYNNNKKLASCISFIQFLFRDSILHVFVSARSQNIENFVFDNQTYLILAKNIYKFFPSNQNAKKIEIHVRISSLHKFVDPGSNKSIDI
jgi:thymidylate synthase